MMPENAPARKSRRGTFAILLMAVVLCVLFVLSFAVGRYRMSLAEMWSGLTHRYEVGDSAYNSMIVMIKVRLPRILGAMLVGGCLSMSGAAFQGVFGNPLVSPDLLGTSSGAGLGACIAILSGLRAFGVQLSALAGGVAATVITVSIARTLMHKRSGLIAYVLVGIIVSALFEAGISISKYISDPYSDLEALTYWLMGSIKNVTMAQLGITVIPAGIGFLILAWGGYRVNLLSFSDEEAMSMGLNVRTFRLTMLFGATLMSAASVALAGVVGWVGLVVPHIARILTGPDNKKLFVTAFLTGAAFLLLIDNISRTLLYFEIPVSILTGAIGAPVFIILLLKGGNGGWR